MHAIFFFLKYDSFREILNTFKDSHTELISVKISYISQHNHFLLTSRKKNLTYFSYLKSN